MVPPAWRSGSAAGSGRRGVGHSPYLPEITIRISNPRDCPHRGQYRIVLPRCVAASCYRTVFRQVLAHLFRHREQDMRSALRIARAAYEKVLSVALDGAGFAKV